MKRGISQYSYYVTLLLFYFELLPCEDIVELPQIPWTVLLFILDVSAEKREHIMQQAGSPEMLMRRFI